MWETLKGYFGHSVTILWARVVALSGIVFAAFDSAGDLLGLPGIKEDIQSLLDPAYVPYYLIGVAIVTELARRRSLPGKDGR